MFNWSYNFVNIYIIHSKFPLISLSYFYTTAEMSLIYDANGNLVTGDGKYRVYNSLNQLVQLYNGTDTSGILLQEYLITQWKKVF